MSAIAIRENGERASGPAMLMLTLPMPPSTNRLFKQVGRRRVPSRIYEDWKGHAGWVLRAQLKGGERLRGPYLSVIAVERDSSTADIDNRLKAIFDLLVSAKVTDDDSKQVGFCVAWSPAGSKMARVMLLPAANYGFQFHLSKDGSTGGWFLSEPQPETEIA